MEKQVEQWKNKGKVEDMRKRVEKDKEEGEGRIWVRKGADNNKLINC